MRKIWFLLLTGFLFCSCQEEVFLPLDENESGTPTIEALWTDQGIYNEVKITLANTYYDSLDYRVVKDAVVVIREKSSGKTIPFQYIDGTKSYRTNPAERARPGETYELTVTWRGNVFQSSGLMLEAPIVDSVTWKFEEERFFREEGYYIKVYGKAPFLENNNYRIRVIENDTLKNQREDYLLFDDTFGLDFFQEGLELGYAFQEKDRVRLELYRLNRDAFDYLNQLVNLLFNDGGLFSPPPQNPVSNIKVTKGNSEVLGYFVVSPVLSRSVVIQEKYD
jgi:hypothetical protein